MQKADSVLELGLAAQDPTRQLWRHGDWVTDKVTFIENQLRGHNLKICDFPEGTEENVECCIFIWPLFWVWRTGLLPSLTQLIEWDPPPPWSKSAPTRDIFANLSTKQKIISMARIKVPFAYQSFLHFKIYQQKP